MARYKSLEECMLTINSNQVDMTTMEIAQQIGCQPSTIHTWLAKRLKQAKKGLVYKMGHPK